MGEVRLNQEGGGGGERVREGEILIEEGKRKTRRRGLLPSRIWVRQGMRFPGQEG